MPALTPRQAEVMRWACEGKTAAETAIILAISEETARDHLRVAREALGAVNVAQACVLFDRTQRPSQDREPDSQRGAK